MDDMVRLFNQPPANSLNCSKKPHLTLTNDAFQVN